MLNLHLKMGKWPLRIITTGTVAAGTRNGE